MPTYEYKCDACEFEFERFQPITSKAIKKCPKCGKSKVRRLIGIGSGMIFKGSGFYTTDYRDSSYKESAKADTAPSTSSSETKSDAKSETKGETKSSEGKSSEKSPESKPAESKPAATTPKAEPKASKSAKKR